MDMKKEWPYNFIEAVFGEDIDYDPPSDLDATIAYILFSLEEVQRDILIKRYVQHETFATIGTEINLSKSEIQAKERKALRKIKGTYRARMLLDGVKGYSDGEVRRKIGDDINESIKTYFGKESEDLIRKIDSIHGELIEILKPESYAQCYILDKRIEELDLSTRAYNVLKRADAHRVRDIINKEDSIINKRYRHCGDLCAEEIISKMHELGFNDFGKKE